VGLLVASRRRRYHLSVDVLLGDGGQPDVGPLNVEKRRSGDVGDGGANLLTRVDDIHAKRIHSVTSDVISANQEDIFSK